MPPSSPRPAQQLIRRSTAAFSAKAENETSGADRRLRLIVAGCVLGVCIVGALLGGPVVAIVAVIAGACTLQGLWRGASEIVGVLVGMFVAAFLCRPLGRAMEGAVSSLCGTSGLTNRFVSVGLVALLVSATISIAASVAFKRFWKAKLGAWMRWNYLVGAGLGLIEGAILSMLVLWTPLFVEPIARAEVSLDQQLGRSNEEGENVMARRAASWATAVRESALGSVAIATNPTAASPIVQLLEDFVAVSNDEEAMEHFVSSEPLQRLKNLPSVGEAIRRLEADPELTGLIKSPSTSPPAANTPSGKAPLDDRDPPVQISGETVRAILGSDTLLKILDETTVVQDLAPMAGDIGMALREAKQIVVRKSFPRPPKQGGG